MKELEKIKDRYESDDISSDEALKLIFDVYLVSDTSLAKYDLKVAYIDYGSYQLRLLNDQYLYEGEKSECLEYAKEIIDRIDRRNS